MIERKAEGRRERMKYKRKKESDRVISKQIKRKTERK